MHKPWYVLLFTRKTNTETKRIITWSYNAKPSLKPGIGQTCYRYEKNDEFIAAVKLLADHTWVEI